MTKAERLEELKVQDAFYKVLDKYFDAGWREFVKGIRAANDISNFRMFKIVRNLKGNDFVKDLIAFMSSTKNKHALLELSKEPKGMKFKDARYKTIPELWIDKYPSGQYREGDVYFQIKDDRWLKFTF